MYKKIFHNVSLFVSGFSAAERYDIFKEYYYILKKYDYLLKTYNIYQELEILDSVFPILLSLGVVFEYYVRKLINKLLMYSAYKLIRRIYKDQINEIVAEMIKEYEEKKRNLKSSL